MRHIRVRLGGVAAILLLVQVASAAVSSLNACCDDDRHGDGMRCCRQAGTGHMCRLMGGQQTPPMPSGELHATCANGHDEGVPLGGPPALAAERMTLTIEWRGSAVADHAIDPTWRPLASLSPPPRA